MKKRLLAVALVFALFGGAWAVPIEPAKAAGHAQVDLVLRCLGPLNSARTRPVAVPPECEVFLWARSVRTPRGWQRGMPLPPDDRTIRCLPPTPVLPTPVPLPGWLYTLVRIV